MFYECGLFVDNVTLQWIGDFSTVEQEKQNQLAEGDDTNGVKD